ncbi:MAG: hypothetical protein HOK21_07230 [Rhodospirillaceae bacterium]|nr:hypothetical protein [Rhodospirillaceae bacterium]MBT4687398.1 hypothetical protein [Rhodospirillaceae bacterium]MBT5079702.1 hypothetical protein [Rhodospirillaceae bacterium]MBT5523859.1 hypothetical protein [Rhodospirillaceae bacterium]MBT5882096.1 hypothetical protein [Rhodospirillaceae bacterium]
MVPLDVDVDVEVDVDVDVAFEVSLAFDELLPPEAAARGVKSPDTAATSEAQTAAPIAVRTTIPEFMILPTDPTLAAGVSVVPDDRPAPVRRRSRDSRLIGRCAACSAWRR